MAERVPATCPSGSFQYLVAPGDTLAEISRRFGVSRLTLRAFNPHIPDPESTEPGDILCIPGTVRRPCSVALAVPPASPPASQDIHGVALITGLSGGQDAVSVLVANLPPPQTFGPYDAYQAVADIPFTGEYCIPLYQPAPPAQVETLPPIWSGTAEIPPALTPETTVYVRAAEANGGATGPALLEASLTLCRAVARS